MGNTFVIGDIHGGLKALHEVLEKAVVQKEDTLIFLGDYVDGWSESAQVVDLLLELETHTNCIFIKGNHDVWCEEWLRSGKVDQTWFAHGGKQTIESYSRYSAAQKMAHLLFFESLRFYYVDEQNRLFIHAGFTSMHGPKNEVYHSNYNWDRTLWELALAMDKRIKKDSGLYPKRLLLYNEIFIGHTPTLHIDVTTPMNSCNVWNVDTGAAFTGSLSILNVETKAYYQSETLPKLYPKETGRNSV